MSLRVRADRQPRFGIAEFRGVREDEISRVGNAGGGGEGEIGGERFKRTPAGEPSYVWRQFFPALTFTL